MVHGVVHGRGDRLRGARWTTVQGLAVLSLAARVWTFDLFLPRDVRNHLTGRIGTERGCALQSRKSEDPCSDLRLCAANHLNFAPGGIPQMVGGRIRSNRWPESSEIRGRFRSE